MGSKGTPSSRSGRRRAKAAGGAMGADPSPGSGATGSARPTRRRKPEQRFRRARAVLSAKRIAWASALMVLLLPVCVLAGFALSPGPGTGQSVEIEWSPSVSSVQATQRLRAAGLVRSAWLMRAYVWVAGGADRVSPGIHLLQDNMTPRTLWRRLQRATGGAKVRTLIPEGFNKFDIASRLHSLGVCSTRAFLEATRDAALLRSAGLRAVDAEGYLFPATYEFARNEDPATVLRRMTSEADRRYAVLFDEHADGLAALQQSVGFGRHEAVVLASIVEKEAAVDDERPVIAGVFLNRLRSTAFRPERRLQSDPTARYGCLLHPDVTATCAHADVSVTGAMVRDPLNPYSSYAHPGLPPGPICSPGERSLLAVLHPAQTSYLYFFARGDGRHTFSETYTDHLDAIRERTDSGSSKP